MALVIGALFVFGQTWIAHAETSPAGSPSPASLTGISNTADTQSAGSGGDAGEPANEPQDSEGSESETESEEAEEAAPDVSEGADSGTDQEDSETGSEDSETGAEDTEAQSEDPGGSASPSTSEAPSPDAPDPHESGGSGAGKGTEATHPHAAAEPTRRRDGSADGRPTVSTAPSAHSWHPDPTWGAYSTAGLVRVADRLRRQGWTRSDIARRVYAPFPVQGLAAWSDTWGAPRYAGGYHPHQGQDLLCAEGTPLLAVQPGTVQFHTDPLGGTTIFLVRGDGSFWYYAHLSAYAHDLVSGASVERGQVIGFCGATGDATISHLHFALFDATGDAVDPMPYLLRWLHEAERRSDLRASTGRGVSIPDTNGSETGDPPPAIPVLVHAADPESVVVVVPIAPPHVPVQPKPGLSSGVVAAVAMLLLPLPLTSRRVRQRLLVRSGTNRLSGR